jgi:hypothetical protein
VQEEALIDKGDRALNDAELLALENRKLEERLKELKDSLRKQKEARAAKGGYSWKSGRSGGIGTHTDGVLQENSKRRLEGGKMKFLEVRQTSQ